MRSRPRKHRCGAGGEETGHESRVESGEASAGSPAGVFSHSPRSICSAPESNRQRQCLRIVGITVLTVMVLLRGQPLWMGGRSR
jgi:hypothetical protein